MEKIVASVCTAKRPQMLLACLRSLASVNPPVGAIIEIVVIDNEVEPNNCQAVMQFADSCPFRVHYVHERRRGIPQARNAAVTKALELGADWLAFIDDDETAEPDWLIELYRAGKDHKADTVAGPVAWEFPEKMPFWGVKTDPPFGTMQEGEIVGMMPTCNGLASTKLFRSPPNGMDLRFDEELAFCGGEDARLGREAAACGARMVWTTKAVVRGVVCSSRLTYAHHLRASYNIGFRDVVFNRERSRIITQVVVGTIKGGIWFAILPFIAVFSLSAFKRKGRVAGRYLARAAGNLAGIAGIQSKYYQKIDGH